MKQMEVTILGQSYVLGCPDGGEAALLDAVSRVDREMSAIRDAGRVRARERIAVLAALNLAYALAQPTPAAVAAPPDESLPTASGAALPEGAQSRLDLLVHRIDDALDREGRLL